MTKTHFLLLPVVSEVMFLCSLELLNKSQKYYKHIFYRPLFPKHIVIVFNPQRMRLQRLKSHHTKKLVAIDSIRYQPIPPFIFRKHLQFENNSFRNHLYVQDILRYFLFLWVQSTVYQGVGLLLLDRQGLQGSLGPHSSSQGT